MAQQPDGGTPAAERPATGDATSASNKTYDDLIALGQERFAAKDYDGALAALSRAYAIKQNPNLLYNQARILEAKGDLEGALAYYEQFAVAPDVDIEYRRETLERIRVLKETLALTREPEKPVEQPVVATPTPVAEPIREPAAPRPARRVGAVMMGVGGATLLAGGVFGVLAYSEHQAWGRAGDIEERRTRADQVGRYGLVADSLYLGGGVVTLVGMALFIAGRPMESASVSWSPVISKDGAGAQLGVRF